jgi:HD-GYP domain-containing protein (c-di-GMP phosphodiesterase class II)
MSEGRTQTGVPPTSPDTVQALVKAIELKDLSTAAHTWRVVLYTRAMAEAAGIDHEAIERYTTAAALHDLGKLDIPDAILQKPSSLTPEEFEVIKTHPALGHARLLHMEVSDPILLDLVRHHHERWDGKGYPDGVAGVQISTGPRYFSVIDSFDAMTSLRPYRRDVGEAAAERALDELAAGSGTRYWPEAVEMFSRLYRSGRLTWILHHFNDANGADSYCGGKTVREVESRSRRS